MWHGVTMNSNACRDNNQKWCRYCILLFHPLIRKLPVKIHSSSLLFSVVIHPFWPEWAMSIAAYKHSHTHLCPHLYTTVKWFIVCLCFMQGVKMTSHKYALMCFTNFTNYSWMIYHYPCHRRAIAILLLTCFVTFGYECNTSLVFLANKLCMQTNKSNE